MSAVAASNAGDGQPSALPPPLFELAHSNGGGGSSREEQPVTPEHDGVVPQEDGDVDLSRAGVLLGRIDTPALACFTEHGAVPYLTRGACHTECCCVDLTISYPFCIVTSTTPSPQTCCWRSRPGTRAPSAYSSST